MLNIGLLISRYTEYRSLLLTYNRKSSHSVRSLLFTFIPKTDVSTSILKKRIDLRNSFKKAFLSHSTVVTVARDTKPAVSSHSDKSMTCLRRLYAFFVFVDVLNVFITIIRILYFISHHLTMFLPELFTVEVDVF